MRETREEVAKSGEVLRESRLVFLSGVGEGEKNNLPCLLVLGLFCVVRLLVGLVLWLFRDGLFFFDPDCPISAPPFFIFILFRLLLGEEMPTFSFLRLQKSNFGRTPNKKTPSN